jgi:NhaP-type Na+/H+ or K+/H+ antiporter
VPVRLLVIGLPLTIIVGTLVAAGLFAGLSFWEGAVLAAILAPTDAALGQAVVSSRLVPVRIRQALNVESGVNDGVVLPLLLILLAVAGTAEHTESVGYWVRFTALQITLGPLVGIGVGYVGGKLVELASRTGWMNHAFQQIAALGLALLAFAAAELVGGNGFIAAFVAGLVVGNFVRSICGCLFEFGEAEGELLTYFVFGIFGAVMVPRAMAGITAQGWLYAGLSLTVIRMVPVALSLVGSRLRPGTVLFLGWFGPRGLASILFALLMLEEFPLTGSSTIVDVVVATVLLSVFAHGITAVPWANLYARHMDKMKDEPQMPEHMPVEEMPTRRRMM